MSAPEAIKLTVDGEQVEVTPGTTLLQACEAVGREIPRFCYHDRLSIAGNCRMCLVEVENIPKPVASCAMPAGAGMVVHTKTPSVRKARSGIMEFLLINHPLDCPICDQGGECDLQDQAVAYGADGSRFAENKRAVEDKYLGPLIKTVMTRCIHCTRCVRFASEIAGVPELGASGRGEDMEITTYLEHAMTSELSGNVIDLCPVGALTSKPYAYTARSWELEHTQSVDVMDALGSAIRIDTRGSEVMRILPRGNEAINEEWLSDKSRFICDGLQRQRLDQPYVRGGDGRLRACCWDEAFAFIETMTREVSAEKMAALAGDLACAESIAALGDLMSAMNCPHIDCREPHSPLGRNYKGERVSRRSYLFNTSIAGIEEADAILLIGADVRREASLLDVRLRKAWRHGGIPIASIASNETIAPRDYESVRLGEGVKDLQLLFTPSANGRGNAALTRQFREVLDKAQRPMLILGQGALSRPDGGLIYDLALALARECGMIKSDWNGFNILHTAAARVAGLDLDFLPKIGGWDTAAILRGAAEGEISWLYLLGVDERVPEKAKKQKDQCFVIYQGSHGDAGAKCADVVLPAAAYTEKNALWVNTEGRIQAGRRALFPPGDAREDWKILRKLSDVLGHRLPYDDVATLHKNMINRAPQFAEWDRIMPLKDSEALEFLHKDGFKNDMAIEGAFLNDSFISPIQDFYLSNSIARASALMAQCASLAADAGQRVNGNSDRNYIS